MSAEAWVFQYEVQTPFCKADCTVSWTGPGRDDWMNSPTTDLSFEANHLDIMYSRAFGAPEPDGWPKDYAATIDWVFKNEAAIIQNLTASGFEPEWTWDT